MSITVVCMKCQKKLKAPDHLAGKKARCSCGEILNVPAVTVAPVEAAPRPAESEASLGAEGGPKIRARMAQVCPSCKSTIEAGETVCQACGFNLETGKRESLKKLEAEGKVKLKKKSFVWNAPEDKLTPRQIMVRRATLAVGVLLGIGALVVALRMATHDPVAIRDELCKKLAPQMSVEQVVGILGTPTSACVINVTEGGITGEIRTPERVSYSPDFIAAQKKKNPRRLDNGFYFVYPLTDTSEDQVHFDAAGKYVSRERVRHTAQ